MRRPHAQTCIAIETAGERLQKHAKPLGNPQRSQKCQTHLLARRYGAKAGATARGTTRMSRTCAGTRNASKRTRNRLKTRAEKSKCVRGGQEGKTHLADSKRKRQSVPSDGITSVTMGMTRTHRNSRRSKALAHETERSSLDGLLRCWEILRALRRVLRSIWLAVRMANVTVTWTALSAAATTTRIESQQRGWLHKVSKCARTQERNKMTYQCRPGNPRILEYLSMESLGRAVDAEQSHSDLKTSVERAKSKLLTLDALTRCGRCGGLKTKSDGRRILLPSARVRGSAEKLKTMDEELTR